MNLEQLKARKAELEAELKMIEEFIKIKESNQVEEVAVAEEVKTERPMVETSVTTKETSKGTQYTYIVKVDGQEFKRNSKKEFTHIAVIKEEGKEAFVSGFASSKESAQSNVNGWLHMAKGWVVELA